MYVYDHTYVMSKVLCNTDGVIFCMLFEIDIIHDIILLEGNSKRLILQGALYQTTHH
jgi:hypothetical protein